MLEQQPSSPEQGVTKEEMIRFFRDVQEGVGDATVLEQIYIQWCKIQEAAVRSARDTLDLEITKAEMMIAAGRYQDANDILDPIYQGGGNEVRQYEDLRQRINAITAILDENLQ